MAHRLHNYGMPEESKMYDSKMFYESLILYFQEMPYQMSEDYEVIVNLRVGNRSYSLRLRENKCAFSSEIPIYPHLEITGSEGSFQRLFSRSIDLYRSYLNGSIQADGDLSLLLLFSIGMKMSKYHSTFLTK